jgi:L-ascorbate metabolism protein UlaG (beta-lactamase superfamily)
VVSGLEDQTVPDDEEFPWISLDDCVADADHADDAIVWSLSGGGALKARILAPTRQLRVSVPDAEWRGSETIRLEACDPEGACDAVEVVYTVVEENDAPVIDIRDQMIPLGQTFPRIALDQHVTDVDSPVEEMTWNASGGQALALDITARVLTLDLPSAEWHGSEQIQLQACDAGGACGSAAVTFAVLDDRDLLITFTSNAGFLIGTGGKKILLDALYPSDVSPETLALMENAEPPFDGVDLVLATHDHSDHFGPQSVGKHLSNNPEAVFVSTESAVEMLREGYNGFDEIEDRVHPIHVRRGSTVLETFDGIEVEMLSLSHGIDGYLNMGFVITVGENRLFHTGDSGLETMSMDYFLAYDLPGKEIDVAFVSHFILLDETQHAFILEGIQARYVIPMHFLHSFPDVDYEAMELYFPEAILFHEELESWLMPRE